MAKKNYDNDIRMELIRYLENPDSIGFDKKKRKMQEYYPDRIRDQRTSKIDEFFKIHNISYNQKQWPNKITNESKNTKNENKTDTTKTKSPSKFSLILMALKEIAKKSLK